MESVVGPLLVEKPLEVAASAGGESLEKDIQLQCRVKRATTQLLHFFLLNALS